MAAAAPYIADVGTGCVNPSGQAWPRWLTVAITTSAMGHGLEALYDVSRTNDERDDLSELATFANSVAARRAALVQVHWGASYQ